MKPRLLDLFCCAGGASKGYADAGFEVVGVDIEPQPNYPFEFHQADALTFPLNGFHAVAASPPCRDHTWLTSVAGFDGSGWTLAATRTRLEAFGLPYVIENVMGAKMRRDLMLCGEMFGLRTIRHRQFEVGGGFTVEQPAHHTHTPPGRPPAGVASGGRRDGTYRSPAMSVSTSDPRPWASTGCPATNCARPFHRPTRGGSVSG